MTILEPEINIDKENPVRLGDRQCSHEQPPAGLGLLGTCSLAVGRRAVELCHMPLGQAV